MLNQFAGCMPAKEWLDACLPSSAKRPKDAKISWNKAAVNTEEGFIKAYNKAAKSGHFSNLAVVDTHNLAASVDDYREKRKPDMCVFGKDVVGQVPDGDYWDKAKFTVERKGKSEDIVNPTADSDKNADIDSIGDRAVPARGQTISYAMQMFRAQPLLFTFSVLLIEDEARFIRWDRSGAIVSARFNWVKTQHLTEFFWRCNRASDEALGRDPTVTTPTEAEAKIVRSVLQEFNKKHPDFLPFQDAALKTLPMQKIAVFSDAKPNTNRTRVDIDGRPSPRYFVTPRPHIQSESLTGRATMGYYAVEVSDEPLTKADKDARAAHDPVDTASDGTKERAVYAGEVCYLKDTWRIALDNIEKEGDIYATLAAADVPHTAKMLCAGDVWSSDSERQETLTPRFERKKAGAGSKDCKIIPHIHYRIVLSTIGKPLSKFKTTKQLCEVLRDAIKAHEKAYEIARILHRDVSFGNILITIDGTGILIDWDLCRDMDNPCDARRPNRTGTWPFMSIALLANLQMSQGLSDDCESFFWVLIFTILRYHKTTIDRGPALRNTMQNIFDDEDDEGIGGNGKTLFLTGRRLVTANVLRASVCAPLAALVGELRRLFFDFYPPDDDADDRSMAAKAAAEARLSDHGYLLATFTRHLDQNTWPEDNDAGEDMLPKANIIDRTHKKVMKAMVSRDNATSGLSGHSSNVSGSKRGLESGTSGDSKRIKLERTSIQGGSTGAGTSRA